MSSATGSGIFPTCASFWKKFCPERTLFDDYEVEHQFESIGQRTCCSTPAASIT